MQKIILKILGNLGLGKNLWTSIRNYKTTVAGVAVLITGIASSLEPEEPNWSGLITSIVVGLGFLWSKDGDKSSKKLGIKD